MIPHTTVAINEAKSKLLDELIGDSQTDPRPIIVTQVDNTESKGRTVAMLQSWSGWMRYLLLGNGPFDHAQPFVAHS